MSDGYLVSQYAGGSLMKWKESGFGISQTWLGIPGLILAKQPLWVSCFFLCKVRLTATI